MVSSAQGRLSIFRTGQCSLAGGTLRQKPGRWRGFGERGHARVPSVAEGTLANEQLAPTLRGDGPLLDVPDHQPASTAGAAVATMEESRPRPCRNLRASLPRPRRVL